ncbi:hypothetical protein BN59_03546 [Legionella massiliensis]|uniref:Uncharacterized protein n=1 Tax=Legionella massiliensis TaxID=1034943 RepID=A0A078L5L6_9GAMM|nr:hypothetical protein [Legionella massiliensis]CDZ79228.1 hypothetical protein BN59_03546 [Legionella massiliensis]CEE14966.1 hypothetical protein BN1094_03546 [Legionella massiliensis]
MEQVYQGEDQKKYHFLFMLSAKQAVFKKENGQDSMILNNIDEKLLFMTARPGRTRAFMSANKFLTNWQANNTIYLEHQPRIALIDSDMNVTSGGIAEAQEITLKNPSLNEKNNWEFDVVLPSQSSLSDIHHNITLMIDWPASMPCVPTIKIQLPSLINDFGIRK